MNNKRRGRERKREREETTKNSRREGFFIPKTKLFDYGFPLNNLYLSICQFHVIRQAGAAPVEMGHQYLAMMLQVGNIIYMTLRSKNKKQIQSG